ncbi:hypothetical protein [Bradyrhizobium zhanjiangense]|uniref:hypothetical protein n=1 Tax=Bradyrhizobium zhanjiangense TaxID=1325107 RepID=UPI0019D708FD|nr:hypothetical protein [Bradyrhizobium zhanjiangense]
MKATVSLRALVRGVDEIIALHAPIHETIYRDSTLENEVIDVVAIGDGVAVAHSWSRLTVGAGHPAGPHSVDSLIQAVLTPLGRQMADQGARKRDLDEPTHRRAGPAKVTDPTRVGGADEDDGDERQEAVRAI